MSNLILRLEIDGTVQPDIDLNDIFQITASGSSIASSVAMNEQCKATRTVAGEFAQSVGSTLVASMKNYQLAMEDDYIDTYNLPLTITRGGVGLAQSWNFYTDLDDGFYLEVVSVPSYVTVYETPLPEEEDLLISDIVVEQSGSAPCTFCRNRMSLDPLNNGTPPYTLIYGTLTQSNLQESALEFPLARLDAIGNSITTFNITDSGGLSVTGIAAGLQSASGNQVSGTFSAVDANKGSIILTTQLQACLAKDQEIILEARLTDSNGDELVDWTQIYEDRTGASSSYSFDDIPLGTVNVSIRDNFLCTQTDKLSLSAEAAAEPFVAFPISNALSFIDKAKYSKPKHFTTRRLCDFEQKNSFNLGYAQKFLKNSNLWIQFQSSYTGILVELVDANYNVIDISSTATVVNSVEGINWINIVPNLSALEGIYHLRVTFSSGTGVDSIWLSEFFQVQASYTRTVAVKWKNQENGYGYYDGMFWGTEFQEMIIDAEYLYPENTTEKTILIDTNNRIVNLDTENSIIDYLDVFWLPHYMKERFVLGLGHYQFLVSEIEYQTEETPEFTPYTGSLFFKGEVQLRRVNYEIY